MNRRPTIWLSDTKAGPLRQAAAVGGSCDAALVIERPVDFGRQRRMCCGTCGHEWFVNDQWLDRFDQGLEACPECGTDCQVEDRPDFCARPDDPSHNDTAVLGSYWYHSSTHENWPDRNFDPAGKFTKDTRRRMESMARPGSVERWAERRDILKRKARAAKRRQATRVPHSPQT